MPNKSIQEVLMIYFKERYGVSSSCFEKDFMLVEYINSLGMFELLQFIKDELGVEIDASQINEQNFSTFKKMTKFVTEYA